MPRLIVVSNRVPHHVGTRLQPGGLTVAVQPVLKAGDLWAGWSGRISDHDGDPSIALAKDGIGFVTLDLTPGEHRGYYTGFANGTLWPLLHFRPHLMRYEAQEFAAYQAVNEKFARALARVIQPDDRIWIHDYHLMTLGARLRRLGVKNRIGFFLHIPFAPPSLFSELPCAADIINALCACDVLGFQTRQSAADFIACAREISGLCVSAPDAISDGVRRVQVGVIPAGIETDAVAATARHLPRDRMLDRLAASLGGKALVIGTDRLDYSKGIASRFEAYARLLTRWPEHKRNVSFLQIAAPSREDVEAYAALKRELDRKTGELNGRFAEFDWVPLRYVTRSQPRDSLIRLFRRAKAGVVTPFRDGMNLVAKEFVAAQDPGDPGVLVLSALAGAAEELSSALIVNPHDCDDVARAIHTALTMACDERIARHTAALAAIRASDASRFGMKFLAMLG
ncbi:MAG TPA: trehalose-6-phosphate synthase [Hyphomonas sp.]|nr:trehalose-6-phosphate synthase [Hyphomonas sp.]